MRMNETGKFYEVSPSRVKNIAFKDCLKNNIKGQSFRAMNALQID